MERIALQSERFLIGLRGLTLGVGIGNSSFACLELLLKDHKRFVLCGILSGKVLTLVEIGLQAVERVVEKGLECSDAALLIVGDGSGAYEEVPDILWQPLQYAPD